MGGLRRLVVLGVVGVLVSVMAACGGDDDEAQPPGEEERELAAGVFFGTVAFSGDRVAVAVGAADGEEQPVMAFVTDGTPDGDAEWFEGTASGGRVQLTSASGKARLEGTVEANEAMGTITFADGNRRSFHTIPATHGAGIYDVTVTADGKYTGTSESGSQLQAEQKGNFVEGTLTTPEGEKIPFRDVDLSRVFNYPTPGGQAGTYTLIVSRYGLAQAGRGGDVKKGAPDNNGIALDLGASTVETPGVYYGKVAGGTDQFAMVLSTPNPQGARRLRVYLSDGEPEPEGDIEWFVGDITGDSFNLTSASKNATVTGQITPEGVSGELTLAGGQPRRIFAVPAGDGAGIYDVTVTADGKYEGTSEQGGSLTLQQQGDAVSGTIKTPDGREIGLAAYDLTRVFDYPVEGSPPDRYVAFASPGGRYLIGRSGNVRGGTAGNNIIGLDKAC